MPLSLTAIGNVLEVDVHDDNFAAVQDYLRSGMVRTDIGGRFDRYHVRRWTGGRLTAADSFWRPPLELENYGDGRSDLLYRFDGDNTYTQAVDRDDYSNLAMELLGKPGPSFYYQWQEDGMTEAAVNALGAAGWPPKDWPFKRFPAQLCFSPWLTVPGASVRVYVEEPCVARLSATALGALNFSPVGFKTGNSGVTPYEHAFIRYNVNDRVLYPIRIALIVDTNPRLYTDEFANANPNIDSAFVSWQVVEEGCFYSAQRQLYKLSGEVALKGRRWYNFSFKFRDGGIRGCVVDDGGAAFKSTRWMFSGVYGHVPTPNVHWKVQNNALFTALGTATKPELPFVALWETAGLSVEFFYNRAQAYQDDSTNGDFYAKP